MLNTSLNVSQFFNSSSTRSRLSPLFTSSTVASGPLLSMGTNRNSRLLAKVLSIKKDDQDRVIILKLMTEEEIITVVCFYDSNDNTSEHMDWIDSALAEENINQGIIIGGDMNTIIDPIRDQKGFNNKLKLYF